MTGLELAQKLVEGGVKVLLGRFEVAGMVVILAGLVFLLDVGDQVGDGVDFEFLWDLFFGLRLGGGCGRGLLRMLVRRVVGGHESGGFRLGRGKEGGFLGGLTGHGRCQGCRQSGQG